MKTVGKEMVLPFVESRKLCYFNEYKALMEEECAIYSNGDASSFVLLQQYPYGPFASFIGFRRDFFIECLSELGDVHPTIHFAIPLPPGSPPPAPCDVPGRILYKDVYKAFAGGHTHGTRRADPSIRPCTKADREAVASFREEPHPHMIPLGAAFEEFVMTGDGEIYVYTDKSGRIVGYLSCCPEAGDIWDVVYIYVQPEHRSLGIGTKLAAYYLQEKRRNNQIPYYSGVTNPASEAAAVKAGFVLCGERYSGEFHR